MLRRYLLTLNPDELETRVQRRFYDPLQRRIRGYAGIDGVTSFDFRRHGKRIVRSVIRRLLRAGRLKPDGSRSATCYTLTPFKRFDIDKPNGYAGEKRPISAAAIKDVVFQTAVADYVDKVLDDNFSDCSYGYRKKRSAKDAAKVVRDAIASGYTWVVDADIQKFFDNVDHDILLGLVRIAFPGDQLLQTLIRRFLCTGHVKVTGSTRAKNIRSMRGGYVPNKRGLPQGGMLSGLLANLYLDGLDRFIAATFPKVIYVRYADDFVLLGKKRSDLATATRLIGEFLDLERALKLHHDKTHVRNLEQTKIHGGRESLEFLGYRFTKSEVLIKQKNVKVMRTRISSLVHAWSKSDEDVQDLLFRLRKKIEGRLFDEETSAFLGRNWVRYFSLITSTDQLRQLDAFVVREVVHGLRKRGIQITRQEVVELQLPSFVRLHYKMKRLAKRRTIKVPQTQSA